MELLTKITIHLGDLDQPVITDYELCVIATKTSNSFGDESTVDHIDGFPDRVWFDKTLKALVVSGILRQHGDFPKNRVFHIIGKKYREPGVVACSVDPFAYVSHLSAMSFHGITDRIPKVLYISSPYGYSWSRFASDKMKKDFNGHVEDYLASGLPRLQKIGVLKIDKRPLIRISSKRHGAFKNVRGSKLRVSTMGRTFLDMLRKPDSCGGIRHVIDTFEGFGGQYKNLIIDEIERNGNKIEKARAGYLLEEASKINDKRIEKWLDCVQRGGSRKLNPDGEYSAKYNERWCLSINLD